MLALLAFLLLPLISDARADTSTLQFSLNTGQAGQSVFVASPLKNWSPTAFPLTESEPGHYTLAIPTPWLHELPYKFIVDGKWIADPENPVKVPDGMGGVNSQIQISAFKEDPLLKPLPGAVSYTRQEIPLSDWNGVTRTIVLLHPSPNARESAEKTPVLLYFQDGEDYLNQAATASLLANLSSRSDMPVFFAAFIPPVDRSKEYGLSEVTPFYRNFFVHQVVPSVERATAAAFDSHSRVLVGDSLGGLISLDLALRNPELFSIVVSQSGAFNSGKGRIFDEVGNYSGPPLTLSLDVGLYEEDRFMHANQKMATLAAKRQWRLRSRIHPSTHDWIAWRNQLRAALEWVFH